MIWKPEQKDFNKLKQLDRIEYRQVKGEIEEQTETGFFHSVWFSILFMIGIIAFGVLIVIINPQYTEEVTRIVSLCKIIIIYPILMFFLDIAILIRRSKLIKELNNKYFSTSIKPKQRK